MQWVVAATPIKNEVVKQEAIKVQGNGEKKVDRAVGDLKPIPIKI